MQRTNGISTSNKRKEVEKTYSARLETMEEFSLNALNISNIGFTH